MNSTQKPHPVDVACSEMAAGQMRAGQTGECFNSSQLTITNSGHGQDVFVGCRESDRIAEEQKPIAPAPQWSTADEDESIREPVRWFAAHMERKLRAHDDRPGWIGCDADWLLERMKEERKELVVRLRQLAASDCDERTNVLALRVIEEAADVANFAMMIADNARACIPEPR